MKRFLTMAGVVIALSLAGAAPAQAQSDAEADRRTTKAPVVLVSNKLLYSLVAGVMRGSSKPILLFGGNPMARTEAASTGDMALLNKASTLIWIGPELDSYLVPALKARGDGATILSVLRIDGLRLMEGLPNRSLPGHRRPPQRAKARPAPRRATTPRQQNRRKVVVIQRDGTVRKVDQTAPAAPGRTARAARPARAARATPRSRALTRKDFMPRRIDPHVWLDPRNAITLVRQLSLILAKLHPSDARVYRINAARLIVRLESLDSEITAKTEKLPRNRYVTLDKSLQYFESHYQFRSGVRLGLDPRRMTAQSAAAVRARLASESAGCVLVSSAYPEAMQRALASRTTRLVVVDLYATDLPTGEDAYFRMMRQITRTFVTCLDPRKRTQ